MVYVSCIQLAYDKIADMFLYVRCKTIGVQQEFDITLKQLRKAIFGKWFFDEDDEEETEISESNKTHISESAV